MADIITILILVCVLALIVRGMRRGGVTGCEGDCGRCARTCAPKKKLELTPEQEEQLRLIDKRREQGKW